MKGCELNTPIDFRSRKINLVVAAQRMFGANMLRLRQTKRTAA